MKDTIKTIREEIQAEANTAIAKAFNSIETCIDIDNSIEDIEELILKLRGVKMSLETVKQHARKPRRKSKGFARI